MAGRPLRRATRLDLAEVERYPDEWSRVLGAIATGSTAKRICEERVWSYYEFKAWVEADEERDTAFRNAQRYYAEACGDEVVSIADGDGEVGRDKLKVETRLRFAGRLSREKWGDEQRHVIEDRRRGGSEEQTMEQLRELLSSNPDLKHVLLTLDADVVDAEVIEQASQPVARQVEPDDRTALAIAASVYDEPGLTRRKRGKAAPVVSVDDEVLSV